MHEAISGGAFPSIEAREWPKSWLVRLIESRLGKINI